MILLTPEFLVLKEEEARSRLGTNLLVGIIFRDGFLFGKTFNERFYKPLECFWLITPCVAVSAIGDAGDIKILMSLVKKSAKQLNFYIGSRYVTAAAIAKDTLKLFSFYRGKPDVLVIEMVVIDSRENRFLLVNVDGRLKQLADFVVAGCATRDEMVTFDKLTPGEQSAITQVKRVSPDISKGIEQEFFPRVVEVRKPAILFLKEKAEKKPFFNLSREDAALLALETLTLFEPLSENNQFEIAVYQRKKRQLELSRLVFDRSRESSFSL